MTLVLTTYSAFKGYSWSSVPPGISPWKLNQFYRLITAAQGNFRNARVFDAGVVSDGKTVAVFTRRNIEGWDSENRASDYAALAFFPVNEAAAVDLVELLQDDFFQTPTRQPPATLEYTGPASATMPPSAEASLRERGEYLLCNPRATGDLIARLGNRSPRWICLFKTDNILKIECNNWKQQFG